MPMIIQAFHTPGQMLSVRDAMTALTACRPNDPFAHQKAAGALGGASAHGFIELITINNILYWKRIK